MSEHLAPRTPRGVVAGHAGFAAAMLEVVSRITGRADVLRAVSTEGLDPRGIERAIRDAVTAHGARVVFTDLPAGSCTIAARRLARELPGLAVVTGASVPMLLDFVLGDGDGEAALHRAAERAHEAIHVHAGREGGDVN